LFELVSHLSGRLQSAAQVRIFSVAIESEQTIAVAAIDLIPISHPVGAVPK
jgi:hypothetical protein